MEENENGKTKRILALIFSGIYVMIILPIIGIYVSLFVDSLLNFPWIIPFPIDLIIAIIVFIIGLFWAIWSNLTIFTKGEGSPIPLKETQTKLLVMEGPYKYTRNPMVFGYILFWLGLGFLFKSVFLLIGFTLIITIALIILVKLWEEKNLERRFGNSYVEYKKKVSFLIPFPQKKR